MSKYIYIGLGVIICVLVLLWRCERSRANNLEEENGRLKTELEYTKMYIEYTGNINDNDTRINRDVQTQINQINNSNNIVDILNELYKSNTNKTVPNTAP